MTLIPDPRLIKQFEAPLIVLSNQVNSWIGEVIDFRTDIKEPGVFPTDHVMSFINEGKFATQGLTYKEVYMEDYLVAGGKLWFIELVNTNPGFVNLYRQSVINRLNLPFFLKTYDFLGIFGQAIGQPWIHTPFLDYCSVDVVSHLKESTSALPNFDSGIINSIPNESNPEYLTKIIVENPGVFNIKYIWDSNGGIIV